MPVNKGDPITVHLGGGLTSEGTVVDSTRFGVCIRYRDKREHVLTHWFSPSQAPGIKDRYIDRFGAAILVAP